MYAELNRQKDLKRTYHKKFKDLQAVVTTVEHNVSQQQPTVVMSTKAKGNTQVLKAAFGGKNKGSIGRRKGARPLSKGKSNAAKPTTSTGKTSTSPTPNIRDKTKDCLVVIVTMLKDLVEELQAIDQESHDDAYNSGVTQGSDLEEGDSEDSMTEVEEQ